MEWNPLKYPICFTKPRRLTNIISWQEHIPFAFACMQMLRPRIFVELGTFKGDSYCAFCQAADKLKLQIKCFAIDSWKGDSHSGNYEKEVFNELKAYHDPLYGHFSHLIQSTFDEALKQFSISSIDLLHIDGLHTYEAVKHDFEKWLPKMSKRGIVLLHDTNMQERNFGVWKLWEELENRYLSCQFTYGNGLGILAVGQEIPEEFLSFLSLKNEARKSISKFFSVLGNNVSLSGKILECDSRLKALYMSKSWKITRPLRAIYDYLNRFW